MRINVRPIHVIIISWLMIIASRYVFEYVNPWLGWASYGASIYVLYISLKKMCENYNKKRNEKNNENEDENR